MYYIRHYTSTFEKRNGDMNKYITRVSLIALSALFINEGLASNITKLDTLLSKKANKNGIPLTAQMLADAGHDYNKAIADYHASLSGPGSPEQRQETSELRAENELLKREAEEHSARADRNRLNFLKAINEHDPDGLKQEEKLELEDLQRRFDQIDQETNEQVRDRMQRLQGEGNRQGPMISPEVRDLQRNLLGEINAFGNRNVAPIDAHAEVEEIQINGGEFDPMAILRQRREEREQRAIDALVDDAPIVNAPVVLGGGNIPRLPGLAPPPPPPPPMNFPIGGNVGANPVPALNPMDGLFAEIRNRGNPRRNIPRIEFPLEAVHTDELNFIRDEFERLQDIVTMDPLNSVRNLGATLDGYDLTPHLAEGDLSGISAENLREILIGLQADLAPLLAAPESLLMVPVLATGLGLKTPKDIQEARLKLFLQGSGSDMRVRIETTKGGIENLLRIVNGNIMQLYRLTDQLTENKRVIEDTMDRQLHTIPAIFTDLEDSLRGLTNIVGSYPERLSEYLNISPFERRTPTEISTLQNCDIVMADMRLEQAEAENAPFLTNAGLLFTALREAYNGSAEFQRLTQARIDESMDESKRPIRLLYQAQGPNMEDLRWIRGVLAPPAAVGVGKSIAGQYERFYRPSALHPLETLALFHILSEDGVLQENLPRNTPEEIDDANKAGNVVNELLRNLRLHYGTASAQFSQQVLDHFDLANDASNALEVFVRKLGDGEAEDFAKLMMRDTRSDFVEQEWQLRTGCPPVVEDNL